MKVSIICTNYNKGKWIGEAIESFLKQKTTFSYEILVVDDASTDESVNIIKEYEKKFPNLITAFYHEKNIGITKTWKSIVKKASGEYIARCDGDDYWTDVHKLQNQVKLLESTPDSKWSNTDFDMVDNDGNVIQPNVFENHTIPLAKTYEQMLVYKLMTMSSTWLVEKNLMLEVSEQIDDDAADDTFNLQLELFKKTNLSTLMQSTTVYRMNVGSDSKPVTLEKFKKRFEGLKNTQKDYIIKYPDFKQTTVVDMLLDKDCSSEVEIFKRDLEVTRLTQLSSHLREISENQNQYIEQLKLEVGQKSEELSQLYQNANYTQQKLDELQLQLNKIQNSYRWKIPTKIINFFRRKK
ncbi:glycosyltransferase family 2 protein [Streptococcus equinus]|uniref:glycosyltransferase family 2 protein n=1 Tax=Streptococcus equinus TaxID=1335 RepID=UPI003BF8DF90